MSYLKAVYFPGPSGFDNLPYRKALVYKEDVPFFLEMGATLEQPEEYFESPEPITVVVKEAKEVEGGATVRMAIAEPKEKEPSVGDKGDGEPGSFQWHKSQIDSMRVKKKIVGYVEAVAGKDAASQIDENKTLTVIKLRAKKLIKEFLDNDDQG